MIRFGYAWTALVSATFHRLWWSLHSLLLVFPAAAIWLFVLRWRGRFPQQEPEQIVHLLTRGIPRWSISLGKLAALPGVIKQLSISFYVRSWIYRIGEPWGVEPPSTFLPISAAGCAAVLMSVAGVSVLLSLWVLQRKEYIEKES